MTRPETEQAADILAAINAYLDEEGGAAKTMSREKVTADADPPLDAAGVLKAQRDVLAAFGLGEDAAPTERPDVGPLEAYEAPLDEQLAADVAAFLGFDDVEFQHRVLSPRQGDRG